MQSGLAVSPPSLPKLLNFVYNFQIHFYPHSNIVLFQYHKTETLLGSPTTNTFLTEIIMSLQFEEDPGKFIEIYNYRITILKRVMTMIMMMMMMTSMMRMMMMRILRKMRKMRKMRNMRKMRMRYKFWVRQDHYIFVRKHFHSPSIFLSAFFLYQDLVLIIFKWEPDHSQRPGF